MGQINTERVSHTLTNLPNTFRDDQLQKIIDDLNEEESGWGFSEVIYSGVFVQTINVWTSLAKTKKRTSTVFTYTGAFVTGIVKTFYDEETGLVAVSTISATITYDGNKKVVSSDVQTLRM